MSGEVVSIHRRGRRSPRSVETVLTQCIRPACGQKFPRKVVPGRRREYCTRQCQELANIEKREALARLKHYERETEKLRAEYARFVHTKDTGAEAQTDLLRDARTVLDQELNRAIGALTVTDRQIPLAQLLEALVAATNDYLDRLPQ